jgi:HlyD family secretion protein
MNKKLILGVVALVLLGGAGALAFQLSRPPAPPPAEPTALAEDTSAVLAVTARVTPLRSAMLSLPSGGVVAEVLVGEGDQVQAGQVIARLTSAQPAARVAQAEAVLARAQAAYAKLRAGPAPEDLTMAEADLAQAQARLQQARGSVTAADVRAADAGLAEAQAELAQLTSGPKATDLQDAEAQLQRAQVTLIATRDQLSAAKTAARSQMEQAANLLRDRQADYSRIYWENHELADRLARFGQELPQENRDREEAALRAVRNAEEALKQAQLAYDQALQAEHTGVVAAEAQVDSAQAQHDQRLAPHDPGQVAAAKARLANTQAQRDKLLGDTHAATLDAAQSDIVKAQARLDELRAGPSSQDLELAEADMRSAQAALELARAALAETELHAPFAGTIATLDLKSGEYVGPGTPIARLADLTAWQIETTDLTELDIGRVRVGAPVQVTFDALPGVALNGAVARINAFGESKQGDITYTVVVVPNQQNLHLRWNMTASVAIAP